MNMMKSGAIGCLVTILCFFFFFFLSFTSEIHTDRLIRESNRSQFSLLKLHETDNHVHLDNGIVKLTLVKPSGTIARVGYQETENVLDNRHKETRRGYWDMVWVKSSTSQYDALHCTSFNVVAQTEDRIEVSFTNTWNVSHGENVVPLNIDKRYIILRGVSGFYSYAIFEHLKEWPGVHIGEARIVFKLDENMFRHMVISDDMQREMPTANDRKMGRTLDFKEAVVLENPINPALQGEVDDKYQYSCNTKDNRVHGWISSESNVGFWVIRPSDEFRGGGPLKQDLTSHASSTSLAMFLSSHYVGVRVRVRNGEAWKKVLGPVFIYLNSENNTNNKPNALWEDAKRQMLKETKKWPYDFPASTDYAHADQRGTITGRLLVRDSYLNRGRTIPAKSAYVGVAAPGYAGSWQRESKGYQFWTQTDETGSFIITSVRAGKYRLYAWVPTVIGDFKHEFNILIEPGSKVEAGDIVYSPPRNGPTLWDIGIADRPDPDPTLVNKLFINHTDKYRQYGLWERYTDLYPDQDLTYIVGKSDYRKHWFFAHVNRKVGKFYKPTTWKIIFDERNVMRGANYTLRLALASAQCANIQVWINDNPNGNLPHFETGRIGKDNAIARHGIHGLYWLYSIKVAGVKLLHGTNTVYLKQSLRFGPFNGVLYDYIRLEAPPT
ncbi:rhamnogalacturonan endolyase [Salvia divinorum]|uniref:rhamnogalacturonan endolyase n=1 Tax=Salvia divinorum TaxID=28513 RepID=A0ABD1IDI8_SALDI